MMVFKRAVSLLIIVFLLVSIIPLKTTAAQEPTAVDMEITVYQAVYSYYTELEKGAKGVDCRVSAIKIEPPAPFKLNPQFGLEEIKITANGIYDETSKFDVTEEGESLVLRLKNSDSGMDQPYYRLRETTMYSIYIPQGFFIDSQSNEVNRAINFSFVTASEDMSLDDILVGSSPENGAYGVDHNTNTIEFVFVDDIQIDPDTISGRISITTSPVYPGIPGYEADSIDNYNIYAQQNRLVLEAKDGAGLKDFAKYQVVLEEGAVKLADSPDVKITNDRHIITFTTDRMLINTYPENNQQKVEIEPTIQFEFKHPIEILDKTLISLSSGAEEVEVDEDNITVSGDTTLVIEINDLEGQQYPLRKNTLYRVTVGEGAVRFRDYPGILNREMELWFITGNGGQSPHVTRFSSNIEGTDDITSLMATHLSSDGSIFIHFDREIRWDKHTAHLPPLEGIRLYKIPGATKKGYSKEGMLYDAEYTFDSSGISVVQKEEVVVEKAEIIQANILRIDPKYPLLPLNKYRLTIDRELIEDTMGYNIQQDIDVTFWTKEAEEPVEAYWTGIQSDETVDLREDADAPYKSYTLFGAPRYDSSNPIVLLVDGEVIKKAGDDNAFDRITLVEGYDTNVGVDFQEYRLEYYFQDGTKKTKLYLYPARPLDYGKYYRLNIAGDVFQTRSGNYLKPLELSFVTSRKKDAAKGIYGLYNNIIRVTDFVEGEVSFSIRGFNFNENIAKVTLIPISGNAAEYGYPIVVDSEDVDFENSTLLVVKLRGEAARDLSKESHTGEYRVVVNFDDNSPYQQLDSGVSHLTILSKGRPAIKGKFPDEDDRWYDEKSLHPRVIDGVTRYFIKITFEDIDGSLRFNDLNGLSLINTSTVYPEGSSRASLVDSEFIYFIQNLEDSAKQDYISTYIFNKNETAREAYLYIPVEPLRPNTTYTVTINSNIVYFSDVAGEESGNSALTWSFTTMTPPVVNSISPGSVPEDYDEDEPIVIKGDFFYSETIKVYFNEIMAEDVRVKENEETGEKYLEVYLPFGRNRLEPGIYTVTVQNDANHSRKVFGSFSVIKKGKYVPEAGNVVKKKEKVGDVVAERSRSRDTLFLKSRYVDERRLELDLDELMGEDVLVRRIKFEGDRRDSIDALETHSKWADIILYGLTLDYPSLDDEITLNLGRTEPLVVQAIRSKLRGVTIRSEFIQVTGENFKVNQIALVIPFDSSDGSNLKALRYDTTTRSWSETSFYVDKTTKRVTVFSEKPGIFVIVE